MGFKTFGFGGGRADIWQPEEDIYWGAETEWLATSDKPNSRYSGDRELENPLAAVQMGLIYVNPQGPDGNPDPVASGRDVRETFKRMAMNDEETVALTAGGHTFGKMHGAGDAALVGVEPEGAPIEAQGFGWLSKHGSGKGGDADHQRTRRRVEAEPHHMGQRLLRHALRLRVGTDQEPRRCAPMGGEELQAGAHDPRRARQEQEASADDDHGRSLAAFRSDLREDLARFHQDPQAFADAFARAWFKLTHRDMGPKASTSDLKCRRRNSSGRTHSGGEHKLIDAADIAALKSKILASGLERARTRFHAHGRRLPLTVAATSVAAPMVRVSTRPAEVLGGERSGTRQSAQRIGEYPEGIRCER